MSWGNYGSRFFSATVMHDMSLHGLGICCNSSPIWLLPPGHHNKVRHTSASKMSYPLDKGSLRWLHRLAAREISRHILWHSSRCVVQFAPPSSSITGYNVLMTLNLFMLWLASNFPVYDRRSADISHANLMPYHRFDIPAWRNFSDSAVVPTNRTLVRPVLTHKSLAPNSALPSIRDLL